MAVTRRDLLKRGLTLIGAAAGVGAAGGAALSIGGAGGAVTTMVRGVGFHAVRSGGSIRTPGEAAMVNGDLVDESGAVIGSFHSSAAAFAGTGAVGPVAASRMEWHVLSLPAGSIFGMGAAGHDPDTADTFAIVGGTGTYTGATGTYIARQGIRELGGDGSAEFAITIREA